MLTEQGEEKFHFFCR